MNELDGALVKLAFQAVRSPQQWQKLLKHLIDVTPASAAIITLRDKKTCQIVNDNALEQEYHSPLIQGFSLEAVTYYLEELRTIDPWAKAQIRHYPHRPTVMSKVMDPRTADDRRFFDWLEMGGLRDTIAFELERMPGHWTAINFFMSEIDTPETETLLSYCNVHFEILREAWQSSQHVLRCQQSGMTALNHLSKHDVPACILTPSGEIFQKNAAFQNLIGSGITKISQPSGRLSLCLNADLRISESGYDVAISRHGHVEQDVTVSAVPFEPDPLYSQKKEQHWLLRFETGNSPSIQMDSVGYPLEHLTHQERKLFDVVSKGAGVQEGGQLIGIQRSRTFEVWAQVKGKLGISNAHELRGLYSILL